MDAELELKWFVSPLMMLPEIETQKEVPVDSP